MPFCHGDEENGCHACMGRKNKGRIYAQGAGSTLTRVEHSIYGKKEPSAYACYSLDNVSVLENKLKLLKKYMGIESYLTGFSGGVRYVPVIRYNKVHMYLAPEDIQEAISYLEMKEVSSGSNVVIFPLKNDSYIKDSRKIEESLVVSTVQIYLDCMQLKGRGEEMAEAVLMKEIIK
jgi:hypothetical protein